MKTLLNIRQTAQLLTVSEDVVRALIRSRKLEACRVGGAWRVPMDALDRYLETASNRRAVEVTV